MSQKEDFENNLNRQFIENEEDSKLQYDQDIYADYNSGRDYEFHQSQNQECQNYSKSNSQGGQVDQMVPLQSQNQEFLHSNNQNSLSRRLNENSPNKCQNQLAQSYSIRNNHGGQVGNNRISQNYSVYNLEALQEYDNESAFNLIKKLHNIQSGDEELKNILIEKIPDLFDLNNYKISNCLDLTGKHFFFTATQIEKDGSYINGIFQITKQQPLNDQNIQILKSFDKKYFIQMISQEQIDDIQVLILESCDPIENKMKNQSQIEIIKTIFSLIQGFMIIWINDVFHISQKPLNILIDVKNRFYINFNPLQQQNQINGGNQTFKFNIEYLRDILLDLINSKQQNFIDFIRKFVQIIENEIINKQNCILEQLIASLQTKITQLIQESVQFQEIEKSFQNLWDELIEYQKGKIQQ
ncbi:hypothetical protein ABPG74_019936 [Tetrahymena malaccensis]